MAHTSEIPVPAEVAALVGDAFGVERLVVESWHGVARWYGEDPDGGAVVVAHRARDAARWKDVSGDVSLLARALYAESVPKAAKRVMLLTLPALGRSVGGQLDELMTEIAPDLLWAVVSPSGQVLRGNAKGAAKRPHKQTPRIRQSRAAVDPFSDANELLLKMLILSRTSLSFWRNNEDVRLKQPPEAPLELAAAAGVSHETVYRFLRAFTEMGFVIREDAFRVVRLPELLNRWFASAKTRQPTTFGARSIFIAGKLDSTAKIQRIVRDAGELNTNMIVGGAAHVWIVDPIQMALDSLTMDARGEEQANFIAEQILGAVADD